MYLDELGIPQVNVSRDLKDELEAKGKKQGGAWAEHSTDLGSGHYLRIPRSLSRASA